MSLLKEHEQTMTTIRFSQAIWWYKLVFFFSLSGHLIYKGGDYLEPFL